MFADRQIELKYCQQYVELNQSLSSLLLSLLPQVIQLQDFYFCLPFFTMAIQTRNQLLQLTVAKPTSLGCFAKYHLYYTVNISDTFPRKYVVLTSCHYQNLGTYNQFHNILRLFDVLPNFPFTTSETMCDYYL